MPALQHQPQRLFEVRAQRAQVLGAEGAVDDAVVAGHCHFHPVADHDLAIDHDRLRGGGADREDRHVGRIDDGGEVLDAPGAEVGDGEVEP